MGLCPEASARAGGGASPKHGLGWGYKCRRSEPAAERGEEPSQGGTTGRGHPGWIPLNIQGSKPGVRRHWGDGRFRSLGAAPVSRADRGHHPCHGEQAETAASSQQPRQGTVREMEHSGTKQGLLGDLGVIQSSLSWGGKAALWWAEERSRLGLDQHHAGSPCGAVGRGPGRGLLSRVGTRPGTPGALHSLWDIPIPSLPLRWPHSLLLSKR